MRPKRRWLTPVLVAAAVVGVIGLAVPVLNNASDGNDDSAGTSASSDSADEAAPEAARGGAKDQNSGPSSEVAPAPNLARDVAALSSATFGEDVARVFFPDQHKQPVPSGKAAVLGSDQETYRSEVEGLCPTPAAADLPYGWVVAIMLDGKPARLLISQPAPYTDAVAFTCDGSDAHVLATASLVGR
jgi:hypothetical protein